MLHKRLALLVILLVLPAIACVDVLAVPGVKVSPDGNTIYFLETQIDVEGEDIYRLAQSELGTTDANFLVASEADQQLAFAVNPINGDVAFFNLTSDDTASQGEPSLLVASSDGTVRELVDLEAIAALWFPTAIEYSPDGNFIALTIIVSPDRDLLASSDSLENAESEFDIGILSALLLVIDVNSGDITIVTDSDAQWPNTIAWSPNGQLLVYNAWVDSNGDGLIDFSGGSQENESSDASQIYIYELDSEATTQLTTGEIGHAPVFLSDSQVAYAVLTGASATGGTAVDRIDVYDVDSATSQTVYTLEDGIIIGLATAPDGSQVVWTEINQVSDTDTNTGSLMAADTGFTDIRVVNSLDELVHPVDGPVWAPDSGSVLVTSTNIFSLLVAELASSFEFEAEEEEMVPSQVFRVDMASGTAELVYEGSIQNSNFILSAVALVASGALDGFNSE